MWNKKPNDHLWCFPLNAEWIPRTSLYTSMSPRGDSWKSEGGSRLRYSVYSLNLLPCCYAFINLHVAVNTKLTGNTKLCLGRPPGYFILLSNKRSLRATIFPRIVLTINSSSLRILGIRAEVDSVSIKGNDDQRSFSFENIFNLTGKIRWTRKKTFKWSKFLNMFVKVEKIQRELIAI